MAVKIRMARYGTKKKPFYRIVAADKEKARNGRFIEILGTFNPMTEPPTVDLKKEKIESWIAKGAIPSETVASIFKKNGIN